VKVLVFIGPSGSGKSTLIRELHARGVVEVMPSWTTRPQRHDEAGEGLDHRFVGEAEFGQLERAGFFLEAVEMFGFRYGLPAPSAPRPGSVPAIVVRAPLLELVAKHFPDHLVYQVESDLETVTRRLHSRGETEIPTRLAGYVGELDLGRECACRIFDTGGLPDDVVDDVKWAVEEDFHVERSTR
jgi:guanylate kinase